MQEVKTSTELYNKIQKVIDVIDITFFSGKGKEKIPQLVFAINNQCRSCVTAFVQPGALYDKSNNTRLQYMGINPKYLNRNIAEILATICHELCYIYENAFIHIPRGGYHDKCWENLMADCGLTAVSTKITEGGEFEKFVDNFIKENGEDYFNIVEYSPAIERQTKVVLGLEDDVDDDDKPKADNADIPIKKYNRNKVKYICPKCDSKVWGKAELHIICGDCECEYEEEVENEEN